MNETRRKPAGNCKATKYLRECGTLEVTINNLNTKEKLIIDGESVAASFKGRAKAMANWHYHIIIIIIIIIIIPQHRLLHWAHSAGMLDPHSGIYKATGYCTGPIVLVC